MPERIMQERSYIMSNAARGRRCVGAVCLAAMVLNARAQPAADQIVTRVSAEVLARPAAPGKEPGAGPKLQAAERVVPGDVMIYTVEVRNTGSYAVESAVVIQPIPNHTRYLADSAVGPGVDVDYSVDGGRSFDSAQVLKQTGEYTHIRWRLHNRLKPNSVAYVRFRVQIK
jgi:uncharacterized repeat protein (TIGR01451 family)